MSKYNEVMEHIKVDDSMKQRLLQNLEKSDRTESAANLQKEGEADKGKAHDDRHDKDKVHDDEHDKGKVHDDRRDRDKAHDDRHDKDKVHDDEHDKGKVHDDRRDRDKVHDDEHDKGKVHDDRRDKDKADNNGHNHGRISSFGDRFSKSVRRFGGLAAMFAVLLVGAAAVIQITGNHGNFSTSPSFNPAPAESAVMEAESEETAESTDHDAYETSAEMTAGSEETAEVADYDASETSALEKAESEAPAETADSAENENIILTEAESAAPSEHAGSAVKDASPSVNLDSEQVQDVQESAAAENSTVGTTEGFDADLAKREDEVGTAQLSPAPEQSITSSQAVHSDEKAAGTSAVLDDSNSVNIAVVILVVIALIILLCVAVFVLVKKNGTKKRTD